MFGVMPMLGWLALYAAFPGHEETHALFDDGPSHLHYLMAFGAGWLLRVRPALFESVARCWKVAAVLALLAFLPIAWTEWTWPGDTRAPGGAIIQIGRAHVCTPVTTAHTVCRRLLDKKK